MTILSKERLILFFIASLSLFVILLYLFFLSKQQDLEKYSVTINEFNKIINSKSLNTNLKIDKLYFNNIPLFIDKENNMFYSLIENDKKAYKPLVKTGNKYKIAFLNPNINKDIIQKNIPLKMIVFNEKEYNIQKIYITTLPLMSIENNKVYFYDNSKNYSERIFSSLCELSIRGSSSTYFRKKNFKLKLLQEMPASKKLKKFEHSFLDMPKTSVWFLYGEYNDQDKIRHVLSSKLWQEAVKETYYENMGFECKYIELFIDGKYMGLYALGYPVKPKNLNLIFGDYLLKVRRWADYKKINKNNFKYFNKKISVKYGDNKNAFNLLIDYIYTLT